MLTSVLASRFLYNKSDGFTYSTVEENGKSVRIEVPPGYVEVSNLLRAVDRSLRSLSRRLFASTDRTYVAPRAISSPKAKRKVKQEGLPGHRSRPPLCEIIDWP
jgi:hypothetical protein